MNNKKKRWFPNLNFIFKTKEIYIYYKSKFSNWMICIMFYEIEILLLIFQNNVKKIKNISNRKIKIILCYIQDLYQFYVTCNKHEMFCNLNF